MRRVLVVWAILAAPALASARVAMREDDAPTAYVVELEGQPGRDFAAAPLKEALLDAADIGADVVVVSVDSALPPGPIDGGAYRYLVEGHKQMGAMLNVCHRYLRGELPSDEMCVASRRLVVWIKNADGIASSLAWGSGEVYFAPGAVCGCARAHAERWRDWYKWKREGHPGEPRYGDDAAAVDHLWNFAEEIGEDSDLCRALHQTWFGLEESDGGRLRVVEREPRGDKDEVGSYVALDANSARRVGLSRGTAGTLEEVLRLAGVTPGYRVVSEDGARIMQAWRDSLVDAEDTVLLNLRLAAVARQYRGSAEDADAIKEETGYLWRAFEVLRDFGAALDHRRLGAWPEELRDDVSRRMDVLMGWLERDRAGETLPPALAAASAPERQRGEPGLRGPVVYKADLVGELGRSLTASTVRLCLEKAAAEFADVVILRLECTTATTRWDSDQMDLVDVVREIGRDITRFERGEWPAGSNTPRGVVVWFFKADGVAGLMPLEVRDAIFASEARLGGLGFLENWARETTVWSRHELTCDNPLPLLQRKIERDAEQAGHPPDVAQALLRPEWKLLRGAGGGAKLEFTASTPLSERREEELGPVPAGRFVSFDAGAAAQVGLSLGTADTPEEVVRVLGIPWERTRLIDAGDVARGWREERAADVKAYVRHAQACWELASHEPETVEDLERKVEHLQAMVAIERKCGDELYLLPEVSEVWYPGITSSCLRRDQAELKAERRRLAGGCVTPGG
jgi:hypothetical protein